MEKAENENVSSKPSGLRWVELIQNDKTPGNDWDRLRNKLFKNPFVPVGMFFTVMALAVGLKEFRKGNVVRSQLMMRYRVGMQGLTIFSVIAGIMYEGYRKKVEANHS